MDQPELFADPEQGFRLPEEQVPVRKQVVIEMLNHSFFETASK